MERVYEINDEIVWMNAKLKTLEKERKKIIDKLLKSCNIGDHVFSGNMCLVCGIVETKE